MKVLDALPTITSINEMRGFLQAGVDMGAEYTTEEWKAIELKKIALNAELAKRQRARRNNRRRG